MEDVIIRKATIEDKEQVNDAHVRSIREVCSKDYEPHQIEAWSSVIYDQEIWDKNVTNDIFYVLEKAGRVEGMIHGRVHDNSIGEIMGLYFTPEIIGQGYGRKAFEIVMDEIKQTKPEKVVISGTVTARPFYEAMGFSVKEIKLSNIRGVDIQTNEMELIL